MRTTIKIDDQLLAEAKVRAAESGRTLNAIVEEALREALARRRSSPGPSVDLPTFAGGRLRPGVDLDDGAALLEKLGKALKALGARDLRVSAHADNAPVKKGLLGGYEDAWALTAARAAAVARWLHEHAGLDPARLRAEGDGEFRPVKPNDSADGRAANRRVVISVDAAATP